MVANITNSFGMGCGLRVLRLRDVSCGVLGLWILVGMFLDWFLASRILDRNIFIRDYTDYLRGMYGLSTEYVCWCCGLMVAG